MLDNLLELRSQEYLHKDLSAFIKESEVLPTEDIEKEKSIIRINTGQWIDMLRSKNFSIIHGREGSKKSFLCSVLLATVHGSRTIWDKFYSAEKRGVAYFDTEQSRGDVQIVEKRILSLSKKLYDRIKVFSLKIHDPHLRLAIIERTIADNDFSYIVIDGVRDIMTDINSQEQATYICTKLLQWTEIYDCHITVVIHENPEGGKVRGHIGTELMNKSQCNIKIKSQPDNWRNSIVSCEKMRGGPRFDDFYIGVNHEGMPFLNSSVEVQEDIF